MNALDVAPLDVFAQAEAILRCGRELQRAMLTLRGADGATSASRRDLVIKKMRATAKQLHGECRAIVPLARDIARGCHTLD
jgi:hypothetical protein